jgi:hypothetical protein
VIPTEGGAFRGSTTGTSALAGTCGYTKEAPERVFQWTAPRAGVATIQTCSATTTNFDTVLYVRQTSCDSGTELSCNDDTQGCGTTIDGTFPRGGSKIRPTVAAGQTYFIVVDGFANSRGDFLLTVSPPAAAAPSVRRGSGAKARRHALDLIAPAQPR